ncbi:MAG: ATP-binding cassette domain-containing protein [Marinirhabdus sp.]|nr:ATP-binding cassette domain-containing protein [Marinirhabdus sp.]
MLRVTIPSFSYPASLFDRPVLQAIDFQISQGEHLAILGESGCGKSTLLHIIYGLLELEHGSVLYNGEALFGPSRNLIPGHSFMKLVSQEPTLMPYTSVAANIAEHLSRNDIELDNERVDELLNVVGMAHAKQQLVQQLSGGQKQRVALARALAKMPRVLLLDEPFTSIDAFRKNALRRNLFSYLRTNHITCIMTTHDAEEGLAFSDRLAILKEGQLLAYGATERVYKNAKSRYEKGMYGEVSTLPAGVLTENERHLLPHELKISEVETPLKTKVTASYFKGQNYLIVCETETNAFFVEHTKKLEKGVSCFLSLAN